MSLLDPLSRLLSARGGRARRVWSAAGHVHIELRRVKSSEVDRFCKRVETELGDHRAVRWVETVAEVGRVVVAFDEGFTEEEDFVECVESVEEDFGVQEEPFAGEGASHPADVEPIVRGAVEIAGGIVGLGLATAQRVARLPPIPYMGTAAGGLAFLEHQPRIRRLIERVIGTTPAELVLSLTSGISQGLAGSPIGPLVDLGHRATLLAEAAARRRRWLDREAALWDGPSGHPKGLVAIEPRSVPIPPGPVEKYADRALLASLGGAALTAATTRSLQRSSAMLQAGLPKAAHFGREGFAAHLGRALVARGILPLNSRSLRLLDRVDCLVLDVDLLLRDEFELTAVVTVVASPPSDHPERLARSLFDRQDPVARRRQGGWILGPLEALGLEAPAGSKRLAAQMAKRGVALGLVHRGPLVALAGAETALRAGSRELVAAARLAGLQVVVAGDKAGRAARLRPDRVVPGGERLPRTIRSLQRAGRVVLLVAGGGSPGLPAADIALGLRQEGGPPPWGADLLSEDDDLGHAYLLVQACEAARQASRQSVFLAGAGATAGAVAGPLGLASGADQRAMNAVNIASAAALANGTRVAVGLARRPAPVWQEAVPRHELDASQALASDATSPLNITLEG